MLYGAIYDSGESKTHWDELKRLQEYSHSWVSLSSDFGLYANICFDRLSKINSISLGYFVYIPFYLSDLGGY